MTVLRQFMWLPWPVRAWVSELYASFFYERHICGRSHGHIAGPLKGETHYWEPNRWGWRWWRHWNYMLHNGAFEKNLRKVSDWAHELMQFYPRRSFTFWLLMNLRNATNLYRGGTCWEWPWQPRCCSFCGGAHPEDIIRLLEEGWVAEGTTKGYKWYIEPPVIGKVEARFGLPFDQHLFSAVPPVKLYTPHFDDEQRARVNVLLKLQYERRHGKADPTPEEAKAGA